MFEAKKETTYLGGLSAPALKVKVHLLVHRKVLCIPCLFLKIDMKNILIFFVSMSDPHFTALEPVRLTMRKLECMYCFKESTCNVIIEYLFGLKTCDDHKLNAMRDCKAYMHNNKLVRVKDARRHPVLGRFLSMLDELDTFSVERSDLTIHPGWRVIQDDESWDPVFITYTTGWAIPVFLKEGSSRITKQVPIINFLNPAIHVASSELRTCIEDAIDCLNEGVYRAEAEEFQKAKEQDRVGAVAEIEGVQNVFYEGQATRVYLTHGRVAEEPATDPA